MSGSFDDPSRNHAINLSRTLPPMQLDRDGHPIDPTKPIQNRRRSYNNENKGIVDRSRVGSIETISLEGGMKIPQYDTSMAASNPNTRPNPSNTSNNNYISSKSSISSNNNVVSSSDTSNSQTKANKMKERAKKTQNKPQNSDNTDKIPSPTSMFSRFSIMSPKNGLKIAPTSSFSPKLSSPTGITSPKGTNNQANRVTYAKKQVINNYDEENLGENFDETPWLPPSILKAMQFKEDHVFRSGLAPLDQVRVIDAPDLSIGVQMYFQFLKSMAWCMLLMTLLSLPCILFIFNGSKIMEQDRDVLGLYRFTLGNIGYDTSSTSYAYDSRCNDPSLSNYNGTCIHFNNHELTLETASYIISAMELAQITVFLCCWLFLQRRLNHLRNNEVQECSIADYSIAVKGLPPNTTVQDLVSHFSSLYPLDRADWKGRPGILHYKPVCNITNTGNTLYLNTWIAECILHKKIGGFISAFKNREDLLNKLYHSRALMKMYSENTPHAHGPNIKLYEKAEKHMLLSSIAIENVAKRKMKENQIKFKHHHHHDMKHGMIHDDKRDVEHGNDIIDEHNIVDPQYIIDAEVVAAFICFEYTESMIRCVHDYQQYSRFPWSLVYPRALKFHGCRLQVHHAPDPEEIAWENLEINPNKKIFNRIRNLLIAFILSVIAFIVILQSTIYHDNFAANIPSNDFCSVTAPSLYRNTSTTTSISSMQLVRPNDMSIASSYDHICSSIIPHSFYAIYAVDGDEYQPVVPYSFDACDDINTCPSYAQSSSYCPCITTSSKLSCPSKGCQSSSSLSISSDNACISYAASFLGYCYCKEKLLDILIHAKTDVIRQLHEQQTSSTCSAFFYDYTISIGLSYISIIVTIIINNFLLHVMKILTRSECYDSLGKYDGSFMMKIFFLMYINLSILVILASARADNLPTIFKILHIFDGTYDDFNASWYGNIGTYFITSFILQAITPLMMKSMEYYVIMPVKRWMIYPTVMSRTSHTIVQQKELNLLEVGPVFSTTESNAELLSLLFLAMSFGAGLPVMMPLIFIIIICYFNLYKIFLCRYHQRPPHVNAYAMQLVINTLPYAVLLRLGVGCWMYSNTDIFPSSTSSSSSVSSYDDNIDSVSSYHLFLSSLHVSWYHIMPSLSAIISRMCRPNVFPLFACIMMIISYRICTYIISHIDISYLIHIFDYYCRLNTIKIKSNKREDMIHPYDLHHQPHHHKLSKRCEVASYSSEFFQFIKNKHEVPHTCYQIMMDSNVIRLSEDDVDNGWILIEKDGYVMKVLPRAHDDKHPHHHDHNDGKHDNDDDICDIIKDATPLSSSYIEGDGSYTYTYDFIADHGTNSYSLSRIPAYQSIITALTESAISLLDDVDEAYMKNMIHHKQLKNRPSSSHHHHKDHHHVDDKDHHHDEQHHDGMNMIDEVAKLKEIIKPSSHNIQVNINLSSSSQASSAVIIPIATDIP